MSTVVMPGHYADGTRCMWFEAPPEQCGAVLRNLRAFEHMAGMDVTVVWPDGTAQHLREHERCQCSKCRRRRGA